jgi:hypothetical protein
LRPLDYFGILHLFLQIQILVQKNLSFSLVPGKQRKICPEFSIENCSERGHLYFFRKRCNVLSNISIICIPQEFETKPDYFLHISRSGVKVLCTAQQVDFLIGGLLIKAFNET